MCESFAGKCWHVHGRIIGLIGCGQGHRAGEVRTKPPPLDQRRKALFQVVAEIPGIVADYQSRASCSPQIAIETVIFKLQNLSELLAKLNLPE
jgi:hypothetical protein